VYVCERERPQKRVLGPIWAVAPQKNQERIVCDM
jgi:hypothetical protein